MRQEAQSKWDALQCRINHQIEIIRVLNKSMHVNKINAIHYALLEISTLQKLQSEIIEAEYQYENKGN